MQKKIGDVHIAWENEAHLEVREADGAVEIHANDTSNYERAEISSRLGRIFRIRFEFYQRKSSDFTNENRP